MDDGLLQYQQGLRIAYVPQEPIFEAEETVFEAVSKGVAEAKALREEYEALSVGEWDDAAHHRLDEVQSKLEALSGWNWEQRVHETLDRLHLDVDVKISNLSGGTKNGWHLLEHWLRFRMFCCWMSQPTTWIWIRLRG